MKKKKRRYNSHTFLFYIWDFYRLVPLTCNNAFKKLMPSIIVLYAHAYAHMVYTNASVYAFFLCFFSSVTAHSHINSHISVASNMNGCMKLSGENSSEPTTRAGPTSEFPASSASPELGTSDDPITKEAETDDDDGNAMQPDDDVENTAAMALMSALERTAGNRPGNSGRLSSGKLNFSRGPRRQ